MVKKGLSLEQKRERVLEVFHAEDGVFQLKEIEKEAVKKGVTLQSVKEVVQSLVDDDMVHQEKIGISNFLWSFAAEASTNLRNKESAARQALQAAAAEAAQLDAAVAEARAGCQDADERQATQAEVNELEQRVAVLREEKAALAVVDPERFEALKAASKLSRDSANRWLDNMEALKGWAAKKFSGRERELDAFFEEKGMTDKMEQLD